MRRLLFLLLLLVLPALAHADLIQSAKESGTTFLQRVHGQVGFGTLCLRATPHENAGGFYFARLEAPFLFDNLYLAVEPRRAAGEDADHEIRWSGSVAYRIF